MIDYAYVYITQGTGAWTLSADGLYRKELIYTGDFLLQDEGGKRFTARVDEAQLQEWVHTFDTMLGNGVQVPVPLEHTTDPEKNRGEVHRLSVEKNSRGLPGLFGYIKFRDEEAEKLALTAQVSIFVPTEFTDGKGNRHHRPIRHVALTDYPVIPNLDGFKAIAASLRLGETDMALRDLAKKLGVTLDSDASDDVVESSIVKEVGSLRGKLKELEGQLKTPKKPDPPKKPPVEEPKKIAAGFLSMARDNRTMKIDRLVEHGKITPAVADGLKEIHLGETALSLSLQDGASDSFEATVAALDKNEPVMSFKEKTGAQVQLGDPGKGGGAESSLVKDAERRAKEAAV